MKELLAENVALKKKNAFLEEENELLREKIRLAALKAYGRSADVLPGDADQMALFPGAEPQNNEEAETEDIGGYTRKKPGRRGIDRSLPREERVIDVRPEDRICGCGAEKVRIGEETAEHVEYVPAEIKVIKTIRPKYACRVCEGVEDAGPTVVIAPAPATLIPKSIVTPSLMSHILTAKIVDSLPFYRQEKQFERLGVSLNRGSMASWTIKLAERCQDIVQALILEAKKRPAIQLDETTVQVMREKGRKNTSKSYMWLLRAGPPKIGPPEHRIEFPEEPEIVVFWYQPTRSSEIAREIVEGYRGYIQTDEYKGYNFLDGEEANLKGWIHVLCLAHARRKFVDAAKAGYGNKRSKTLGVANQMVRDIKGIYQCHRDIQDESHTVDEVIRRRNEEVRPLLEKFKKKVDELDGQVVPKGKLGQAISYATRIIPKVLKYVDCPQLTPDNNAIEREVRPFALGRKNWLMANTPDGAHALATWFTLLATAKANGWNPNHYLQHLFQGLIASTPTQDLMPTLRPTCG